LNSEFLAVKARAETGDANAEAKLGWMYSEGQGVEKDCLEAAKWLRKAADRGDASAQYNLGCMYDDGHSLEKDPAEAMKWLRKAADQGDDMAQDRLGWMYCIGEGVEEDYVEAYAWWNIAATGNTTTEAALFRDNLEKEMSPQQVSEAQKRTRELKALLETKKK